MTEQILDQDLTDNKPILALLEGRPIREGDILYDCTGVKLQAKSPIHKDYSLTMCIAEGELKDIKQWLTNTHFNGYQVLYWENPVD